MALRTDTSASATRAELARPVGSNGPVVESRQGLVGRLILRPIWRAIVGIVHASGGVEGTNRLLLMAGSGRTGTILRRYGARIGENDRILSPLVIHNAEPDYRNLHMGSDCHVGRDVLIDLTRPVELGDSVTVAMRVTLITHMDVGSSGLSSIYPRAEGAVSIGDGAYLGAGSIVLAGVAVGSHAVVAAGAVVTQDVPAWSVVAGVPARVVRMNRPLEDCPGCAEGPAGS
jgi:acetyltransferase-like isoleucine patch superfamily enzyme